MDDVIRRFNDIGWHDSKLLGLSVLRKDGSEQVTVSLSLRDKEGVFRPSEAVFLEATYVETQLDLEGKRVSADDISSGRCYISSEWTKALSERYPYDSFAGFLHFEIYLIPPGGIVNILAKNFILRLLPEG